MLSKEKILIALVVAVAAVGLVFACPAVAKVEGDTIVFGAAVSFTGKYSTNGKHTKNGYDLAAKRLNEMGGVKVDGKNYKLKVVYYDDESVPTRGAQLAERLIKQDGVKFMLGPYSSGLTKAMAPVTEKHKIPMIEGKHPLKKLPAVEEVAATALYLHSPGAVSMTGQILKVDGGMSRAKVS